MGTGKIDEGNILSVLIAGSIVLLAVLSVAGIFLHSLRFGLSVAAGGLLAIGNFYWLRNILSRSFLLGPAEAPRFAVVRYIIRLALLGAAVLLLVKLANADILGLLLGLSVLVFNIMALSIYLISSKGD